MNWRSASQVRELEIVRGMKIDRIEPKRHVAVSRGGARLTFPVGSLAGCIYVAVERDTRGLELSATQRINMYPATPLPSLSWILEGQLHMVDADVDTAPVWLRQSVPVFAFSGPSRCPTASWSPGPVHALTVSFYPDALAKLWGVRLHNYVDTILTAEEVLPPEAITALTKVGTSDDPLKALQAVLQPLWKDVQPHVASAGMQNWLTGLTRQLAHGLKGIGTRQKQRHVKHLTGQSQRELELYARVERAFAYAGHHDTDLASIAASTGYSDQSHLGREVKRVSGLSALRLRERILHDEAFWLYRLLDTTVRND